MAAMDGLAPLPSRRRLQPTLSSVQGTALEALHGKASCVERGYFTDVYLPLLTPSHHAQHPPMAPLINRGYFTRVRALEHILSSFLRARITAPTSTTQPTSDPGRNVNVVSLGAGLDSLAFRILGQDNDTCTKCNWYEIDFEPVMVQKAEAVARSAELRVAVGGLAEAPALASGEPGCSGATEREAGTNGSAGVGVKMPVAGSTAKLLLRVGRLVLVAADLADVEGLEGCLTAAGFDYALPTLIIAECVLVYMEPSDTRKLLQWASRRFPEAAFVSYDMLLPHDQFGRMMLSNLKARGLELPGFLEYGDLRAHLRRYVEEAGWEWAVAGDMNAVYGHLLEQGDRDRAVKVEQLDEIEEWCMIMAHYCYVIASQGRILGGLLRETKGFEEMQRTLGPSRADMRES